jgi:predicted HTH domain antitoxin
MKAMQIEYPEAWAALAGSSPERFESEARMALAMKLFEMGRLTSGHAAQLAGVSRITFLFSCPQWNVPAVNWDADELAGEFAQVSKNLSKPRARNPVFRAASSVHNLASK